MTFKRRVMQRTDYKQRLALLKSGRQRLVVRRSIKGFRVQVIGYDEKGDKVAVEITSAMLRKHGWKAHLGSTPSGYLTGLLAGFTAKKHGINEAVLDIGLQEAIKGSSLFAVAAGARDAGLKLPLGDIAPSMDRMSGRHIASYAEGLKKDKEKYSRQFSSYLKNGIEPEKLPHHFNDVRNSILSAFNAKVSDSKETKETDAKKKEKIEIKNDGTTKADEEETDESDEGTEGDEEWEDA